MATGMKTRVETMLKKAEFAVDDEVKEIGKSVESVVKNIAGTISNYDPLFSNVLVPCGSFYENLKVEQPDEFDYMVCLNQLSKTGVCMAQENPDQPVPDPGYLQVKLIDEETAVKWRKYISEKKILRSEALLERFNELVKRAYNEVTLPKMLSRKILKNVELRKIPVTFHLVWNGTNYKRLDISVDLTLCIKFYGWPEDSDFHLRFQRSGDHPGYSMVSDVKKKGYHLVASSICQSGKISPCWRVSFSVAEGILLRKIRENSPRDTDHGRVIKVLKMIRKENEQELILVEDGGGSVSYRLTWAFHSYVIKTMFFQEWADFPSDNFWTNDKLLERVRGILRRIRNSVREKNIRSFWMSEYKLFNFRARKANQQGMEKCESKLDKIIEGLSDLSITRKVPRVKEEKSLALSDVFALLFKAEI